MTVLIPRINLLNLSWIIKCLFLKNMGSLKNFDVNVDADAARSSAIALPGLHPGEL